MFQVYFSLFLFIFILFFSMRKQINFRKKNTSNKKNHRISCLSEILLKAHNIFQQEDINVLTLPFFELLFCVKFYER